MSQMLGHDNVERNEQKQCLDDTFWAESYPKLQRYCHFLTQNKWDGDDIAQETFLKALKYSPQQAKISTALLNKIAYHHWIDHLRKRKKETIEEISNFSTVPLRDRFIDRNDCVDLLMKKFTPKQAVIFLLKEAFLYQTKEIAAMLETTEMAVKSSLHRAKKRLEKATEEEPSFSVDTFWDEEERVLLSDLINEALKNQDPTVLIKSLLSLKSITEDSKLVSGNFRSQPASSPSSTLCLAA